MSFIPYLVTTSKLADLQTIIAMETEPSSFTSIVILLVDILPRCFLVEASNVSPSFRHFQLTSADVDSWWRHSGKCTYDVTIYNFSFSILSIFLHIGDNSRRKSKSLPRVWLIVDFSGRFLRREAFTSINSSFWSTWFFHLIDSLRVIQLKSRIKWKVTHNNERLPAAYRWPHLSLMIVYLHQLQLPLRPHQQFYFCTIFWPFGPLFNASPNTVKPLRTVPDR